MKRSVLIAGTVLSISLLAGCMGTPEERMAEGISETRLAFEEEPPEANENAGETALYLPGNYDIEEFSDEKNITITNGNDSYILSVNPNETADSKFLYDLQKADTAQEWVIDETFEESGRFGFTTLREIAEDRLEVVVSAGGVKMTTISEESDVPDNMEWMMKSVRSIKEEN